MKKQKKNLGIKVLQQDVQINFKKKNVKVFVSSILITKISNRSWLTLVLNDTIIIATIK